MLVFKIIKHFSGENNTQHNKVETQPVGNNIYQMNLTIEAGNQIEYTIFSLNRQFLNRGKRVKKRYYYPGQARGINIRIMKVSARLRFAVELP